MKQENKTETNARSNFLNFVMATKANKKNLWNQHWGNFSRTNTFSRFGIHQGVQAIPRLHLFRFIALSLLGLLTSHLVGTSLIHSAYAASYVNVSSGGGNSGTSSSETVSPGIVNLGSIKPTSTGTMATGNDTLTIHTDCSAGYKVYVSGQNGKSTNLINSNAEDPTSPEATELISSASNLPNSTSATSSPSSAATLNSNTWGINGNNTEAENNLYYGLPPYSDATAYPLVTKSNVPEESTVPIYYGVKVDTTLSPGTYTGNILYTVLINNSCLAYTVVFSPNVESSSSSEITGTMPDQSITYGETTPLDANAFSREGYTFLGWSTSANGKTGTVTNGIGTVADIDYEDTSNVLNLTSGGGIITLYAIWEKDLESMQDWDGCDALSINEYTTLVDSRDGEEYVVKKLKDGKCWMVQNLRLMNKTITPSDSNVSSNFTVPTSTYPTKTTWCATNSATCDDQSLAYYDSSTRSVYGALYNWYTATASTGKYSTSSGNASSSICPKGWRLPTSGANGDFVALDKAWGGTGANRTSANTYSTFVDDYLSGNNGNFDLSGYIFTGYDDTTIRSVGFEGFWWSSTASSSNHSYVLNLYQNVARVYPQRNIEKHYGFSVRCIMEPKTMQNTSCSSLPVGQTSTLVDARDNQEYTVYRFPNTGTAGTDYPSGMSGYCLMTKDLSLGYVTGGSITKGANLSLSTSTSAGSGTITARASGSDWSTTDSSSNLQYLNGPVSGYDSYTSHSYYSYGAAKIACPKEWSLPTTTQCNNIFSFMGGDNSTGSAKIRSAPYNFIYGGQVYAADWTVYIGNRGFYWSNSSGRPFTMGSDHLHLGSNANYTGGSVRCVASS